MRLTMKLLSRLLVGFGMALSCCFLHSTDSWILTNTNGLMVLSSIKRIEFNGQHPVAQLSFASKSGRDGALELSFEILNVEECKGFGFDDFEGPSAPATGNSLMIIWGKSEKSEFRIGAGPSGSYVGEEGNSFKFSIGSKAIYGNKILEFMKFIANGGKSIKVEIQDFKDKKTVIHGQFDVGDPIQFSKLLDAFMSGKK